MNYRKLLPLMSIMILLSGMLSAQESILKSHHERISSIETSVKTLERVAYSIVGIIGFVQLFPNIKGLFS